MSKNILRKHCWWEDWYGCVFSKMYFVLTINVYMYIFSLDIDNENLQKKIKSLVIPFGIYFVNYALIILYQCYHSMLLYQC